MMTGQIIEESTGFNVKADSVHYGSVSFGRFANEPLLWERRSSFSHNRIEEEVARCSKHRIVTEKKAYFEAQFKKKALLRQCSLDAQTGIQFETCEKDDLDMRSCEEDNEIVQGNDVSCDTSVYTGCREDYDYVEETQISVHFDESSDGSNDFEEQGMMDYHIEDRENTISEPLKVPSSDSVEARVGAGTVTAIDARIVIDCPYSRCNSAEHDVELEQNIGANKNYVVDEFKDIGLCTESQDLEKEPDCESLHRGVCPKVMVAIEPSGAALNVKVTHTQRDGLGEPAKMASRNRTKMGQVSAVGTKTFKQAKILPSTPKKSDRSLKPEHMLTRSTGSISKTLNDLKSSYKQTRVIGASKSSAMPKLKGAPNAHQDPNRGEKVIATKSSGLNTCPSSFRLRSNVRTEEKKEMLSRVKQTDHAQKTEIKRSHKRIQGNTPNIIKQFGRDFYAKAKPVRPLYNKDERLEPKSKDVIAKRPQMNPLQSRAKVVARSMNLKAENGPPNSPSQSHASTGHSRITSYPGKKPTTTCVLSSLVNKSNHPSSTRNAVSTKEMAGIDNAAILKNKMVAAKFDATKGRGTIGISHSISARTKKCTSTSITEKARPQELCRTAAKVC